MSNFFVNIKINVVSTCWPKNVYFWVTFGVTGGRTLSFQTLNFEVFKLKREIICLYLYNLVY